MTIIFIITYLFKIFFFKNKTLLKRDTLPKICVIITKENYLETLKTLSLQTYPKHLFDVYTFDNIKGNYKFKIYNYDKELINNSNYNLVTVLCNKVDLNYLNYTAKEYLKGYDIIFGSSYYNISLLLVKRTINKLLNNKIFEDCFSFDISIFKSNILDFNNNFLLRKFISNKSKLISHTNTIKSLENTLDFNIISFKINPLDKRNFYIKSYIIALSLLLLFLSNNLFLFLSISYLIIIISNSIYLYKYYKIKIIPIILLPYTILLYLIKYLQFRINNKCSDIKSI